MIAVIPPGRIARDRKTEWRSRRPDAASLTPPSATRRGSGTPLIDAFSRISRVIAAKDMPPLAGLGMGGYPSSHSSCCGLIISSSAWRADNSRCPASWAAPRITHLIAGSPDRVRSPDSTGVPASPSSLCAYAAVLGGRTMRCRCSLCTKAPWARRRSSYS